MESGAPREVVREVVRPTQLNPRHESAPQSHRHHHPQQPPQVSVTVPRAPLRPSARVPHTVVRPGPQVRDQIIFPSLPNDTDWDVPAYQRRGGG
jgi:hypothetical protein